MTTGPGKHLSLIEVASLGIGTMIGAGIFALFGEISTLAGGHAWIAFLIAGVISGLTAYAYFILAQLASTNGGIAEYLNLSWKSPLMGSVISLCYYFSIAIVLGLVAKSFAHYSTKILGLSTYWVNPFAILVMLAFMTINAKGVKHMGMIEKVLVIFKLVVLVGFTLIAFTTFKSSLYQTNGGSVPFNLGNFINAIALANLAFAGFGVIANAGGSVKDGARTIGKAILLAILVVMAVYVCLDIAVFGSIPIADIQSAKDYALAEAAKPVLGHLGFLLLGITAIVSTCTNINANLFAASNTLAYMGNERQLSPTLSKTLFMQHGNWAIMLTVAIVVLLVMTLDLGAIGDVASMTFLFVHCFVPVGAALHTRGQADVNTPLLWLAALANGGVLVYFAVNLLSQHAFEVYIFIAVLIFAVIFQSINARIYGKA